MLLAYVVFLRRSVKRKRKWKEEEEEEEDISHTETKPELRRGGEGVCREHTSGGRKGMESNFFLLPPLLDLYSIPDLPFLFSNSPPLDSLSSFSVRCC